MEVVSPEDTWSEVLDKAKDWIKAGSQLVWIVDAKTRSVITCSSSGEAARLNENQIADAAPVVREFRPPVADIFADPSVA